MPRTPEQFQEIREATKQQIIQAGLRVFAHKGFHGASIADIAKEAGVSKGLAYNYFKSKKELARAVLSSIGEMMSEFDKIISAMDDPIDIFQAVIKMTFQYVREDEEFWRMYMSFITQVDMADIAKELMGQLTENYIKKFTKLFRQLGVPNPKAEAYLFGAILDGVPMDYLMDKDNYPLKAVETKLLKKYSREGLGIR